MPNERYNLRSDDGGGASASGDIKEMEREKIQRKFTACLPNLVTGYKLTPLFYDLFSFDFSTSCNPKQISVNCKFHTSVFEQHFNFAVPFSQLNERRRGADFERDCDCTAKYSQPTK